MGGYKQKTQPVGSAFITVDYYTIGGVSKSSG